MMQKIRFNLKYFALIFCSGLLLIDYQSSAQELRVINTVEAYRLLTQQDSLQQMVEVKSVIPSIVYDLRYATKNNFTGEQLYKDGHETFLRLPAVRALQLVQKELQTAGYGLKIWDAYRPYSVTKKMWELIGDERYVANPAKGSGHNRGLALDITLLKEGKEVSMGTGFDHFSDTAHHAFTGLPADVMQHRQLLRTTMEKYGFKALDTEWWHFSFPNDRQYEILNIPFENLKTSPK